jgi:hypothetical protein
MKKFSILLLAAVMLSFSCGRKQTVTDEPVKESPAENFFSIFEKDLNNTAAVISNNELIKNLTHLQRMDFGGSHYYPLEREALTKMIQSLSSYTYADCILINRAGTIIYTMYENRLLSKHAESFPNSFAMLFRHAKENEPWILDVAEFPEMAGSPRLLFAVPVARGSHVEGVLVAAMSAADIAVTLKLKDRVVDRTGTIRLTPDSAELFSVLPEFASQEETIARREVSTADGKFLLSPVTCRNLQWIVVSRK